MGQPMNYDDYAAQYAQTRSAFPWVVQPLLREMRQLPSHATVVEIGCGTGNYIIALSHDLPSYSYKGFDLSEGMLAVARSRSTTVVFVRGNAEGTFPYPDHSCALAFAVDVIHHVDNLDSFFQETARILTPTGRLLLVTDSEANIRTRSLTAYFPEILDVELARYPKFEALHAAATSVGLVYVGEEAAEGIVTLDDSFIAKLEAKCSSAVLLIPEEAYQRGLARVRRAQAQGEQWFSCYTVVKYERH